MNNNTYFTEEYLDKDTTRGKISKILVENINFSKLLRHMKLSNELRKKILYAIADGGDGDVMEFEYALLETGQSKCVEFMNVTSNDVTKVDDVIDKLNVKITLSRENIEGLMDNLILDTGFSNYLYKNSLISLRQMELLNNTKVARRNRVNTLFTTILNVMTMAQFNIVKEALEKTDQFENLYRYIVNR